MFFSMQVMLLGFVLLGRTLEEKARIQASSDMNELLVSNSVQSSCLLILFGRWHLQVLQLSLSLLEVPRN